MQARIALLVTLGICSLFRISECLNANKLIAPKIEATEQEAWLKWKLIEKSMKDGVDNIIKQFLPGLMGSSDVEISTKCMSDLLKIVSDVRQLKLWAVKLLDSIGKPGSGLAMGTVSFLGNYHECLDVEFPQSEKSKQKGLKPTLGQYCMLEFSIPLPPKPKKMYSTRSTFKHENSTFDSELMNLLKEISFLAYYGGVRFGLCLPSTCTKADLQQMIDAGLKKSQGLGTGEIYSCEVKQEFKMDAVQIAISASLIALLIVVIACTILDIIMADGKSIGRDIISAFSLHRNFITTFRINESTGHMLESMNGLRVISLTWVILGHSYLLFDQLLSRDLINIDLIRKDFFFQAICNGYFAVQTFFLITGVLTSYNMVKAFDAKGKSVLNVPILVIRRIWRLQTPVFLVIGIGILMPLMGSGPLYQDTMSFTSENCRKNWWWYLLFAQNVMPFKEVCYGHLWYVGADFQLFLVGLIYFFVLFRKSSMGKIFLLLLVLSSVLVTAWLTYIWELPPTMILTILDLDAISRYTMLVYDASYTQLGVYAVGLGLGTFMARKEKLNLSKTVVVIGWLVSAACALTLVYSVLPWNSVREPTLLESVLYGSLQRPVWALCVSWVILACSYGYSGFVAPLLAWNGFQPLVKMSYLMYILHLPIQYFYMGSLKGPIDIDQVSLVWKFMASLGVTVIAAAIVRILFEAPLMELDKIAFNRLAGSKTQKTEIQNVKTIAYQPRDELKTVTESTSGNAPIY